MSGWLGGAVISTSNDARIRLSSSVSVSWRTSQVKRLLCSDSDGVKASVLIVEKKRPRHNHHR